MQLKEGLTLEVFAGYKMYLDSGDPKPKYKGYSGPEPMEWTILESAIKQIATATAATLIAMCMYIT